MLYENEGINKEDFTNFPFKNGMNKGDIVLDPFAGSFTSAIVANKLGRIGVGCELRKDLFNQAIKNHIKNKRMKMEEYSL